MNYWPYDFLLEQYQAGKMTSLGLLLRVLEIKHKHKLKDALRLLPDEVREVGRQFVADYTPDSRLFNAERPSMRSVRFAQKWFAEHP